MVATMARECREETGYDIPREDWVFFGRMAFNDAVVFLYTVVVDVPFVLNPGPEANPDEVPMWVNIRDLDRLEHKPLDNLLWLVPAAWDFHRCPATIWYEAHEPSSTKSKGKPDILRTETGKALFDRGIEQYWVLDEIPSVVTGYIASERVAQALDEEGFLPNPTETVTTHHRVKAIDTVTGEAQEVAFQSDPTETAKDWKPAHTYGTREDWEVSHALSADFPPGMLEDLMKVGITIACECPYCNQYSGHGDKIHWSWPCQNLTCPTQDLALDAKFAILCGLIRLGKLPADPLDQLAVHLAPEMGVKAKLIPYMFQVNQAKALEGTINGLTEKIAATMGVPPEVVVESDYSKAESLAALLTGVQTGRVDPPKSVTITEEHRKDAGPALQSRSAWGKRPKSVIILAGCPVCGAIQNGLWSWPCPLPDCRSRERDDQFNMATQLALYDEGRVVDNLEAYFAAHRSPASASEGKIPTTVTGRPGTQPGAIDMRPILKPKKLTRSTTRIRSSSTPWTGFSKASGPISISKPWRMPSTTSPRSPPAWTSCTSVVPRRKDIQNLPLPKVRRVGECQSSSRPSTLSTSTA